MPFELNKMQFCEDELNKFIVNKKINSYKAEFFQNGGATFWTVFLDYENVHSSKDNTKAIEEALNEEEKALFGKLKEWRKEAADKNGFPVYVVCNNKEMVELVKNKPVTMEGLRNVQGFGDKKIENYGKEIVELKSFVNVE
ncbi:MAG TPA: HRDC domain-containing protein [Clostridiales bacterium]|nr:HRDC domain-containing protein [Clostridiales bacterium]